VNPAATGPVSEVSNPTVTDLAVTPGALAALEPPVPLPEVEVEPFPQAAAVSSSATVPASAAARLLSLIVVTTEISWSLRCAGPTPASRVVKGIFVMSGIT
jgi:hypothetical protein